jgi:hypothetical protein
MAAGSEAVEGSMAEARQAVGEFHWISNHLAHVYPVGPFTAYPSLRRHCSFRRPLFAPFWRWPFGPIS